MSDSKHSFVGLFLRGELAADDIDDFIDAWHDNDTFMSLAEFLGMTDEQYKRWVEGEDLRTILIKNPEDIRGMGSNVPIWDDTAHIPPGIWDKIVKGFSYDS
jgi:hypothetical protein